MGSPAPRAVLSGGQSLRAHRGGATAAACSDLEISSVG